MVLLSKSTIQDMFNFLSKDQKAKQILQKSRLELGDVDLHFMPKSEEKVETCFFAGNHDDKKYLIKLISADTPEILEEKLDESKGNDEIRDNNFELNSEKIPTTINFTYKNETKGNLGSNSKLQNKYVGMVCAEVNQCNPSTYYVPINNVPEFLKNKGYNVCDHLGKGSFGDVYSCKRDNKIFAAKAIIHPSHKQISKEITGNVAAARAFENSRLPDGMRVDEEKRVDVNKYCEDAWSTNVIIECPLRETSVDKAMDRLSDSSKAQNMHSMIKMFIKQAAQDVQKLHDRSLVHRDLKLENFLCDFKTLPNGELSLTKLELSDFGTVAPFVSCPIDVSKDIVPDEKKVRLRKFISKDKAEEALNYLENLDLISSPDHIAPEIDKFWSAPGGAGQKNLERLKNKIKQYIQKGTLLYESDAQLLDMAANIGPKSDIYSFGLTILEFIAKILKVPYAMERTLPDVHKELPGGKGKDRLLDLLGKMLEKNPGRRIDINGVLRHTYLHE